MLAFHYPGSVMGFMRPVSLVLLVSILRIFNSFKAPEDWRN